MDTDIIGIVVGILILLAFIKLVITVNQIRNDTKDIADS